MIKILKKPLLTLCLLALSGHAFALKSDRDQPIDITADRLEINEAKKFSTYTGNVILKQGSLNIQANSLILYFDDSNELDYMEMSGTPARLKQLSDQQEVMRGSAQKIIYHDKKSLLTLTDDALFTTEKENISSHFIQVNIENDHIKAGKDDKKHRVHMKILPRSKKQ